MIKRQSEMTTIDKPNLRGGDGVIKNYQLLLPEEMSGKANLCAIMNIEPNCSIGEHAHGPDAEIYYVLEGELQACDNGVETVLHTGDSMFTGDGKTHSVRNVTDKTVRMLAIVIA